MQDPIRRDSSTGDEKQNIYMHKTPFIPFSAAATKSISVSLFVPKCLLPWHRFKGEVDGTTKAPAPGIIVATRTARAGSIGRAAALRIGIKSRSRGRGWESSRMTHT
jgi:hypothetical protein